MIRGGSTLLPTGTLGTEVKRLRKSLGLTQLELAALSGVDQASISEIERGDTKAPAPARLRRLADALRVPYDYLGRLAGYVDPPAPPATDIFDRAPLHLLDAELRRLPVAPGFPSFSEQMKQLDSFSPAAKSRMIRKLARDFLHSLQAELEREEEVRRAREDRAGVDADGMDVNPT